MKIKWHQCQIMEFYHITFIYYNIQTLKGSFSQDYWMIQGNGHAKTSI
jgi:hypothetical protein